MSTDTDPTEQIARITTDPVIVRQLDGEMTTEAWTLSVELTDDTGETRTIEGEIVGVDQIDETITTLTLDGSTEFVDIPRADEVEETEGTDDRYHGEAFGRD